MGTGEVKEILRQHKPEGKGGTPVLNRIFRMFSVRIASNNKEIIQKKHTQDSDIMF